MISNVAIVSTLVVGLFGNAGLAASSSNYTLVAEHSGSNFFDGFQFFMTGSAPGQAPDPTSGFVNYTSAEFAADQKLVGFVYNDASNTTNAYVGVDHTNVAPSGRNSVRINTTQTFGVGMIAVIDVRHAPVGPGLWPAVWFLGLGSGPFGGPDVWPAYGEQDVLEWVHDTPHNAVTLHSSPGCTVRNSTSAFQGTLASADCNAGGGGQGCSIDAFDQDHSGSPDQRLANATLATAGHRFNEQGGGVYVHQWTTEGVTAWMYSHRDVPSDLAAGRPDPSSWTAKPLAQFTGSPCDFGKSFTNMTLVINIELCGSWAGNQTVWESSGLADRTKAVTCPAYVQDNPADFKTAYFEFGGIQIYSSNEETISNAKQQQLQKRQAPAPQLSYVVPADKLSESTDGPHPGASGSTHVHRRGQSPHGQFHSRARTRRALASRIKKGPPVMQFQS